MSTNFSSERPSAGGRPASSGARPAGQRAVRPAGARPTGQRPAGNGTRRPPNRPGPRRRKPQYRFYVFIAIAVAILIALGALIVHLLSGSPDPQQAVAPTAQPVATDLPAVTGGAQSTEVSAQTSPEVSATSHADALMQMLGSEGADIAALPEDQMTQITDLHVTQGLSEEWMNILLLGSDERTLSESARTDTMIICSINTTTGEVKLTSILRDLAVELDEIGEYSDTYRINAANYFGGEELAMRVVNECFGMNIERYVHVNFYGFQQLAEMLGGIDMDITEEEMNLINELIVQQASLAYKNGIDESGLQNQFLTTYGPSTHLDGRQTLAYARIRKLDGGDFARAERQRNVLAALLDKLRQSATEPAQLLAVTGTAMQHMRTNLTVEDIITVAMTVLNSDMTTPEFFRLPINDSYVQETRNEQSMLYDCDWATNTTALYNFIYE